MSDEISDFDSWEVFEVRFSEVHHGIHANAWPQHVRRIAKENSIPLELRRDQGKNRYFLALPTAQHYDELMQKVGTELTQRFETRMAALKEKYRKHPVPLPSLEQE